jgi:hypothetical protein
MMVGHTGLTERNTLRAAATLASSIASTTVVGLSLLLMPGMAADGQVAEHRTVPVSTVSVSGDRAIGADGVHLYGEVSKPNQPGKGYFIFSKVGAQVIGAIYYPQSEYSCFVGQQADTRLNVNLVESSGQASEKFEVPLKPMYAINTIGPAEAKALSACRQVATAVQRRSEQTASTPTFITPQT